MHPLCGITRITYSIEGDNTLFRGMCIACTYYKTHQQGKVLQGHHISKQGRLLSRNHTDTGLISIKSYEQNVCVGEGYVYCLPH